LTGATAWKGYEEQAIFVFPFLIGGLCDHLPQHSIFQAMEDLFWKNLKTPNRMPANTMIASTMISLLNGFGLVDAVTARESGVPIAG
jgi:hypothetical protein